MTGKISLTASMRSNLLSLQNISRQVSSTQNKLATGNKVNSAIDNPSSFYTARALNNRADDLNALLDSMGQAVSTIKAATTALETGAAFLEQAAAVATQAVEQSQKAPISNTVTLQNNVSELTAAGYTAITSDMSTEEIQALFDTNGAKIVLAEDITLEKNISINGTGIVFNGGGHKLSYSGWNLEINGADTTIENLEIDYKDNGIYGARALYSNAANITFKNISVSYFDAGADAAAIYNKGNNFTAENIHIALDGPGRELSAIRISGATSTVKNSSLDLGGDFTIGIYAEYNSEVSLERVGINASDKGVYGAYAGNDTVITGVSGNSVMLNIPADSLFDGQGNTKAIVAQLGNKALAAYAASQFYVGDENGDFGQGKWYLPAIGELMEMYGTDMSQLDTQTWISGANGDNMATINTSLTTLKNKGVAAESMDDKWLWSSSEGNSNYSWRFSTYYGGRSKDNKNTNGIVRCFQLLGNCYDPASSNKPQIGDVMYADKTWGAAADYDKDAGKTAVGIVAAVGNDGSVKIVNLKDLTFSSNGQVGNFNPKEPYGPIPQYSWWATTEAGQTNIKNIPDYGQLSLTAALNPGSLNILSVEDINNTFAEYNTDDWRQEYENILNQYDSLIKDAGYKGINLLTKDNLSVKFNEDRSSALNVQGKDTSSVALGLIKRDWSTLEDIAQSLSEISAALKNIRTFSAELGNNYSIITSRQDFTENLINILTEGADKLTLADMNEEAANMLALQTRQQLAVNSLSLASQASQSVLRLF